MKSLLEGSKNLQFVEPEIKILSAMTAENEAQIQTLANELTNQN